MFGEQPTFSYLHLYLVVPCTSLSDATNAVMVPMRTAAAWPDEHRSVGV